MKHLSEEQLVDFHYGEAEGRSEIEAHIRECEPCRASHEALRLVLNAVDAAPVPERDEAYGARVWRRIESKLEQRPRFDWRAWLAPRRLALVGAMAALLVAVYFAGRFSPRHEQHATMPPISRPARERILLVAVGDHLDRSQMLLLELVNAEPEKDHGAATVDISNEQERAEDLVTANRLYRQTALHSGDKAVASLLDELEPLLLDIAHSPSQVSGAQLDEIRKRIEARGIIFKVRVIGSEVREREKQAAPAPVPGRLSS